MLGRWNLATSFSCLLENGELWQLLSAVMTERQILIAGSKLDRVSGIALVLKICAFISLCLCFVLGSC